MTGEYETQQTMPSLRKKISKIGIIANEGYATALSQFRSENVLVFVEKDLTFENLKDIIKYKDKEVSGTVLWLAFTGIHSIADQVKLELCALSGCLNPISCLRLEKDYYNHRTKSKIIASLLTILLSLQTEIKCSYLKEGSDFQMMPPLPICILTNKFLTHDQIHSRCAEGGGMSVVVDKTELTILKDVYVNFCAKVGQALNKAQDVARPAYSLFLGMYDKLEKVYILKDQTEDKSMILYKQNVTKFILNVIDEKMMASSGSAKNMNPCLINRIYDRIIFIGSRIILDNLSSTNPSGCSMFNAKFPLNWFEICDGVSIYKAKYKRVLFIIVADMTIITSEQFEEDCGTSCNSKLSYHKLQVQSVEFLVKSNIQSVLDIKGKLEDYFQNENCVLVSPLFPRLGIRKPYVNSRSFHNLMHKVALHPSAPVFLDGQMSVWDSASSMLQNLWNEHFYAADPQLGYPVVKGEDDAYKMVPLSWQLCSEFSLDEKSILLDKWERHLKILTDYYSPVEGQNPAISDGACQFNATETVLSPYDNWSGSGMDVGKEIVDDKVKASKTCGYVIGGSNFINVLNDLRRFENIRFCKYNFSSTSLLDASEMLSVLRDAKPSDVCFLVFDVSAVTNKVPLKICNGLKCKEPHSAFILPFTDNRNSEINACSDVMHRFVTKIDAFLADLGRHVTVLPLPLPPSQIYCNSAALHANHSNLDWIYKQAHFGMGHKHKWITYLSSFKKRWNFLMRCYYKPFPKGLAILSNYHKNSHDIFKISSDGSEFTGDVSAYEDWIRTVTDLVVSITDNDPAYPEQPFGMSNKHGGEDLPNAAEGFPLGNINTVSPSIIVREDQAGRPIDVGSFQSTSQMNMPQFPKNSEHLSNNPQPQQMRPNEQQFAQQGMHPMGLNGNKIQQLTGPVVSQMQFAQGFQQPWRFPANYKQMEVKSQSNFGIQGVSSHYSNIPQTQGCLGNNNQSYASNYQHPGMMTFVQNGANQVVMQQSTQYVGDQANWSGVSDGYNQGTSPWEQPTKQTVKSTYILPAPSEQCVVVTGFSTNFPTDMILEFAFNASNSAKILEQKPGLLKIEIAQEVAHGIVNQLNNARIGDSYFQAKLLNNPADVEIVPRAVKDNFIANIYKITYTKWAPAISSAMEKLLLNGLDVGVFKSRACIPDCGQSDSCQYYHCAGDRRRNPMIHSYSSNLCPKENLKGDECRFGQNCKFSHNLYEKMYHPKHFQTVLCMYLTSGDECPKYPICKFAHMDSPETFFTKHWVDLIVFGLENSFPYIAGALKASFGLPKKKDAKILFLSADLAFLRLLEAALRATAIRYGMTMCLLDDSDCNAKTANIYLGKPSTYTCMKVMSTMHSKIEPSVLIIDDVEAIFKNDKETESLNSFYQRLKSNPSHFASLQKVFVVSTYNEKTGGTLSRFFGIPLKEVNKIYLKSGRTRKATNVASQSSNMSLEDKKPISTDKNSSPTESKSFAANTGGDLKREIRRKQPTDVYNAFGISPTGKAGMKNYQINLEQEPTSSGIKSEKGKRKSRFSDLLPADNLNKLLQTPAYDDMKSVKYDRGQITRKNLNSLEQVREQDVPPKRKLSTESPIRQNYSTESFRRKLEEPVMNPQWRKSCRIESQEPVASKTTLSHVRKDSSKTSVPRPLTSKMGPCEVGKDVTDAANQNLMTLKTSADQVMKDETLRQTHVTPNANISQVMKDYNEAKFKLIQEHEEETRVFMELPEIHPNYEQVYEGFLSCYRNEFGKRRSEEHLNTNWKEYWGKHLNSMKSGHLERKISILKETLGIKEEPKKDLNASTSSTAPTADDEFTVAKTLDMLEELKTKFGILGHSLQEMINLSRNHGPESDETLEIFSDPEHAQLCNIIIEKMMVLKTASKFTGPMYEMAIQWTTTLLQKAQQYKNNKSKVDVHAIAVATMGKDPSFTLDLIKSRLLKERNFQPSKELINKIYLDVCSEHFNITMGKD